MKNLYKKNTVNIAKDLLGMHLIHESPEGKTVGKIVETEAYLADDPACHASRGKTKRNEQMFGKPGKAYVYFIYGMYHCFNVVTNKEGVGEAVLIRALEPVEGIDLMKKRRRKEKIKELCSGPAKLVMAMGIEKKHNGVDLRKDNLYLKENKEKFEVVNCKRIGISEGVDLPYRFYIKGSNFVSRG